MSGEAIVAITVAVIAALGSMYSVWAGRAKISAEAASTNVQTMMEIRDEAIETMQKALERARRAEQKLRENQERLLFLEKHYQETDDTVTNLTSKNHAMETQLNTANGRITELEKKVIELEAELAEVARREEALRQRINTIKAAMDTGQLFKPKDKGK